MEVLPLALLSVIGVVAIIIKDIYDSTSHSICDDPLSLDENAQIEDIGQEIIGTKGHKRYRTTVYFSDGFKYISHKTDINDHFLTYSISVQYDTASEIVKDAIDAHFKKVNKYKKRKK